jgi:two-component system response regulator NreC
VKVMLVDNRTVVREGLCALIEQEPDLVVVAQAATVGDAGALGITPDVIVTEIELADTPQGEVIDGLGGLFPRTPILVLTLVGQPAQVQSVLAAGAAGYLLKTAATADLLGGIRALAAGETYVQPSLRLELEQRHRRRDTALELTPKEQRVLRWLAFGHTNAEVARLLGVSLRTVETHRGRVYQKLGMRTRAELFQYAWNAGLLDRGPSATTTDPTD